MAARIVAPVATPVVHEDHAFVLEEGPRPLAAIGGHAAPELGAQGQSLAFFPEGTFTRVPGLLPFRLGAFVAAAQGRVPVLPIAIRGTRSVLRAGQWLPRRGVVMVTVGAPIEPPSDVPDSFAAAVRLRDAARAEIAHNCGEPELAAASS
jgi:1-acyl-sn-glycerol-3-phosphate acyltransferase